MFLDVKKQQFDIQKLKENLYVCTFRSCNRFLEKEYEIIVRNSSRFYELIDTVKNFEKVNWWTLSYLANVCYEYNGNYLT